MVTQILTLILGVSLANERLVEYLKTWIPWLANGSPEKTRRILIQLLTFIIGWLGASTLVEGSGFDMLGYIEFDGSTTALPAFMVGLLSTSGSAFWNHLLGYSKAMKDIKKEQAKLEEEADNQRKKEGKVRPNLAATLDDINNWTPPDLSQLSTNNHSSLNS